jgi:hypothetical protein
VAGNRLPELGKMPQDPATGALHVAPGCIAYWLRFPVQQIEGQYAIVSECVHSLAVLC